MSVNEDTCEYVLDPADPETWGGEEGEECHIEGLELNGEGVWECPHEAVESKGSCLFHLPNDIRDGKEIFEELLYKLNDNAEEELQLINVELPNLNFWKETDDFVINSDLDFRYSNLSEFIFTGVEFQGDVNFYGSVFKERVSFKDVKFMSKTIFEQAVFDEGVKFTGAIFEEYFTFRCAKFKDNSQFSNVLFNEYGTGLSNISQYQHDSKTFSEVKFMGEVDFTGAEADRVMTFSSTTFQSYVTFQSSVFNKGCFFDNSIFQDGMNFVGVRADGAIFKDIELSSESTFGREPKKTIFNDAKFTDDVKFESSIIGNGVFFNRTQFHEKCEFQDTTFHLAAKFSDSHFVKEVLFSNVNFEGDVNFDDVDFTGQAKFIKTNLAGARFTNSLLTNSKFAELNLNSADFRGTNCTGGDFIEVNISDVSFNDANLSNSNFEKSIAVNADFREAHLENANLEEVNLSGANLERAKLADADLFGTNLTGAQIYAARMGDAAINTETIFDGHGENRCVYDPKSSHEYNHDDEEVGQLTKGMGAYHVLEELTRTNTMPEKQATFFVRRQDIRRAKLRQDESFPRVNYWFAEIQNVIFKYGESFARVASWAIGIILAFGFVYPVGGWIKTTSPPRTGSPVTYTRILEDPVLLWRSIYHSAMLFGTGSRYGGVKATNFTGEVLTTIEALLGPTLLALLVFVLGRRAAR